MFIAPLIIDLATSKLFVYQNFLLKILSNMAKRFKPIYLAEAVNCCLQSDDGDLDSSVVGLSSDEEEKFDNLLLENYSTDLNSLVPVIHFKSFSFYLFYDKRLVLQYYCHNRCKWEILLKSTFHNFLIRKGIVKYVSAKTKKQRKVYSYCSARQSDGFLPCAKNKKCFAE